MHVDHWLLFSTPLLHDSCCRFTKSSAAWIVQCSSTYPYPQINAKTFQYQQSENSNFSWDFISYRNAKVDKNQFHMVFVCTWKRHSGTTSRWPDWSHTLPNLWETTWELPTVTPWTERGPEYWCDPRLVPSSGLVDMANFFLDTYLPPLLRSSLGSSSWNRGVF